MEKKNNINIVLAFVICLALVGVLIFISKNNKTNMSSSNNGVNNAIPAGDVAKMGDTVAVNYTGRLVDGTVFDSNLDPKFSYVDPKSGKEMHYLVPFIFKLGEHRVISGWEKGITGMRVGEKKTLTIPPEDAYGAAGAGGVIPPNATLIFDVELLKIN